MDDFKDYGFKKNLEVGNQMEAVEEQANDLSLGSSLEKFRLSRSKPSP